MRLRGDDRAQTVQIGAVLLFATLVIAISMYQASVVPQENQSAEYAAYEDAAADLASLRNAMLAASSGEGARGVTVKTGARYPSRILFVNPLDPMGALETTAPANVTLGNANADASEHLNAGEYVASEDGNLIYATRQLRFTPDYNELPAADLVWNNGFVYRDHSRPTPLATQTLIRGNTITLTTLAGEFDASGYTAPVTAVPVSAHVNTITVTNESSDPLTLTVPTQLNATEWEERVLDGQTSEYVTAVRDGPVEGTVTIELEPDEQYELRVARVELTERSDAASVDAPDARYLVSEVDRELMANSEGRVKLVVQARDALNNPVSNWNVTFDASGGSLETQNGDDLGDSETLRTNENGNAVVWFDKTSGGDATVEAVLGQDASGTAEETVAYTVSESATGNGSGGGGAYDVAWVSASGSGLTCDGSYTRCSLNANNGTSVELVSRVTAGSVAFEGAGVDYARNSTFGSLSDETNVTQAGNASTTLTVPEQNGSVTVYAESGGGSDEITIDVEDPRIEPPTEPPGDGNLSWFVTDDTDTNTGRAQYRVSYDVTNASQFENVTVTFENLNNSQLTRTNSSTATSGTLAYDPGSNQGSGDTYNVSIRAFDTSGNVFASNSTIDLADSDDPLGGPIGGDDAPLLESVRVDDTGLSGHPGYYVSYNVSNRQNFQNVEVEFRNLNASWATTTNSSTAPRGALSYDEGYVSGTAYEVIVRAFNANGTMVDRRIVDDAPDGFDPSGNDDVSNGSSPTFSDVTVTDTTNVGTDRTEYHVSYSVSDAAGTFDRVVVQFKDRDAGWSAVQTKVATGTDGMVTYQRSGTVNDEYQIDVRLVDDDDVVVGEQIVNDTADGSIDGSDRNAVTAQVSNFDVNAGQDEFSVQAQVQDDDGDNDMDRIEYVVTDSGGNVVATATRTGSGQQIQPGAITIQSDAGLQSGETYTVRVVGYDQDGNYDWDTQSA